MIKNSKKGFTLIELLVVIAIIGILSAVVLASLNTARTKGKVASAMGSLNSMRAQAELGVDASGNYVADICGSTVTGGLKNLVDAVGLQLTSDNVKCNQTPATGQGTAWAADGLIGTGSYFCVDSTGFAGVGTKKAIAGVCQ